MRITTIRTKGLFGIFDHVIPLNMKERITIIHGPNGFGKTAILRLIADIFEYRHTAVRELPFDQIVLEFDDGTELIVQRLRGPDGAIKDITYQYTNGSVFSLPISELYKRETHLIDSYMPEISRSGYAGWENPYSGERFNSTQEIFTKFEDQIPSPVLDDLFPKWLINLQESLDVHFIRATRLESPRFTSRSDLRKLTRYSYSVVGKYAEELAIKIHNTLAAYAELSQSLDRSFPSRIVNTNKESSLSMEEIRNELPKLEQRRTELTEAGLLDKEAESYFDVSSIDENKAEVLSLYIEDTKKKLSVFNDLYARIDLFTTILNRRFSYKTVSINKNDGIELSTEDGALLAPEHLSSGEQHEVILLYQLLFKVKPDSLILIDEPELSLHIEWQEQFLDDLSRITALSSFDAIVATHSPQIISDKWNLTVELKGPVSATVHN